MGELISDMWETLYGARGCGLAAPQIGKAIRLFLVDSKTTYESFNEEDRENYFESTDTGIVETFINAKIISRSEDDWDDEEGCLSIPNMTQSVNRSWRINIEYLDSEFNQHTKTFAGATARMIQHEYDHTEGILYFDYLSPLVKKRIEGKLKKISKGLLPARYPMSYVK